MASQRIPFDWSMLSGSDPASQKRANWLRDHVIVPVLSEAGAPREGVAVPAPLSSEPQDAAVQARRLSSAQLLVAEASAAKPLVYYLLGARDLLAENLTVVFDASGAPDDVSALLGDRYIPYSEADASDARKRFSAIVEKLGFRDDAVSSVLRRRIAPVEITLKAKRLAEQSTTRLWTITAPEGGGRVMRRTRVGVWIGDLTELRAEDGVDVILNSESIFLEMARFHDPGVSAVIRCMGSNITSSQHESDDRIFRALIQKAPPHRPVAPATTVFTTSGELAERGVKAIGHVAAVQPRGWNKTWKPGAGYEPVQDLESCLLTPLSQLERASLFSGIPKNATVLAPMFGAGNARADPAIVARRLIGAAVGHIRDTPRSRLSRILFLTYTARDLEIVEDILNDMPGVERSDEP